VPKTEFYLPQPCFTGLFQTATLELFPYQPPPEARWAIAMDGGHQQGEVKRTRTQVSLTRPSTCSGVGRVRECWLAVLPCFFLSPKLNFVLTMNK
jgi:hypothetical protein